MDIQNFKLCLILICSFFLIIGCGKKRQSATTTSRSIPAAPPAPTPVPVAPEEKPVYLYSGDRFRDPFIPSGLATNYQPDALFDPQRASVKGIIYGSKFKSAVLTIGGSGSYFVKTGRIFDIMGKPVDGYSAKIYIDKVIVLGEADNVFELKIRSTEEEGKSL